MTLSVFITVISGHDKPQSPGCLLERKTAVPPS
ncbi:EAL domain-containing protein, partial [Escherichia coli]|nr:EAL domain-containing protein [Escherichia coli]